MSGLRRKTQATLTPVIFTEEESKLIKENNININLSRPATTTKTLKSTVTHTPKPVAGDPSPKKVNEYITMDVKGSGDKVYKVVIPQSYAKLIPKTWSWNEKRYKVASMISAGIPMIHIADANDIDRSTIYGWLQHPEFKEHVDGLTMETGWANKRERIAGLKKLTGLLFDKVINEIGAVKLTDKSVGSVLTAIQMIAKQLGQEKEEFIESTRVEQNVTLSGTVAIIGIPVDKLLNSKTSEERLRLEEEFNSLGNSIIQNITGEHD